MQKNILFYFIAVVRTRCNKIK